MRDAIVRGYLRDLRLELQALPRGRREELLSEIRQHIEESLGESPTRADVRNVLEDLGDPSEIASEEFGGRGRIARRPWVEIVTIPLLLIGGVVVPVVGWIVGLVLLWTSRFWTLGERLVGTLLLPWGLLPAVYVSLFSGSSCSESIADGVIVSSDCTTLPVAVSMAVVALVVGVPIWTAIFLGRRLRRRTSATVAPA